VPTLIRITREPLDRPAVDAIVQSIWHASVGGIVTFEGTVRDHARGKRVRYLEYDAYPEMAEQEMAKIAVEVERRWGTDRVALVHRIGRLEIGEVSVVVAVACPHRAEAFEACRYAIDTLKATVPIWKKEVAEDGEEWVEG
jgi:molybdopterin synthase catalytic subunit